MLKLYCPECGEYLEAGSGNLVDCRCGWKQCRPVELDDEDPANSENHEVLK